MPKISMDLDELIGEHQKLVMLLDKTIKSLNKEKVKQEKELRKYISIRDKHWGTAK